MQKFINMQHFSPTQWAVVYIMHCGALHVPLSCVPLMCWGAILKTYLQRDRAGGISLECHGW